QKMARQARCMPMNGRDRSSQTEGLGAFFGRGQWVPGAGRTGEGMTVLMKRSLLEAGPRQFVAGSDAPPCEGRGTGPTNRSGPRNGRRARGRRAGRASGLARAGLGLADGALLAQFGPAAGLTRLLVVLALAQLLLNAAALQQFLEAAQGQADRLSVVNAHP